METFSTMVDIFEELKKDTTKIYRGKNKSAFNRIRKNIILLKRLMKDFRKEIILKHKENLGNDDDSQ